MRALIVVLAWALLQTMPVNAQEVNNLPVVSQITIPDVTGMSEADAVTALEALELSNGSRVEIIKKYEYTLETGMDIVHSQSPVGEVTAEDVLQVTIVVSMGPEPAENLSNSNQQQTDNTGSFGIASKIPMEISQGSYRLLDWDSLPCSYEYNWDNSANCWYYGCWLDLDEDGTVDVKYTTPEGTYDNNVRHKMQLYCDGEYVYLHIKIATIYGTKFNGEAYNFSIDGQGAIFAVVKDGEVITGNVTDMEPGTYQVEVLHGNNNMSSTVVPGAEAYFTKYENNYNAEVELKIPISELKRQNENIDLENMSVIGFNTPNLTGGNTITASGASTFPFATAAAAFLLIPGSTVLLNKKFRKKGERLADE